MLATSRREILLSFGSTKKQKEVLGVTVETAGDDDNKSGVPRGRRRTLRVVVSDAEQAHITRRAAEASLSVSAYLRALGLGYAPKSTLDQRAIGELVKVHANQGRLTKDILIRPWRRTVEK